MSVSPQPVDLRLTTAGVRLDGTIEPVEVRSIDPIQLQVSGIPERIEGPSKPVAVDPVQIRVSGIPERIEGHANPIELQAGQKPFQLQVTGIPQRIEGPSKPLEVQGGAEPFKFKGDLNLGQPTIQLRWDQTGVPVSINVPPDGIPLRVNLTGWPTKIPVEIASKTEKNGKPQTSPTAKPTPDQANKGKDGIGWLIFWIFVAGLLGGIGHALRHRSIMENHHERAGAPGMATLRASFVSEIVMSILAAFMVPGLLLLFRSDLLEGAVEDPYRILGLVSLSVIAATIGEPFVEFIVTKTELWMQRREHKKLGA